MEEDGSVVKTRTLIFHPFLVAVFPVLFLAAHNKEHIHLRQILPALGVAAVFGLAVWFVVLLLLKNRGKAGVYFFFFMIVFFSSGHVANLTEDIDFGLGIGPNKLLFPLSVLVLGGAFFLIRKAKTGFPRLNGFLNVTAGVLVLIPLAELGVFLLKPGYRAGGIDEEAQRIVANYAGGEDELPDIYYIVPDRYPSLEILKKHFGFDNGGFVDRLRGRGFYVVPDGKANYLKTAYSLASSLNLSYLWDVPDKVGEDLRSWQPLWEMIGNNLAVAVLKKAGYSHVHSGFWWAGTRNSPHADLHLNTTSMPEFLTLLYKTSLFYAVGPRLGVRLFHDVRELELERLNYQLQALAKLPGLPGPKFVFAHLCLPHPAEDGKYYVHKDGSLIDASRYEKSREKDYFVEGIEYLNARLAELAEELIEKSPIPPVIIIQSDEGPFPEEAAGRGARYNWNEAPPEVLAEKAGILNAVYWPGFAEGDLYPGLTPVNTFRILFGKLFDAGLELLPDRVYAFENEYFRYKFRDVTEHLKPEGEAISGADVAGGSSHVEMP